jgi:hypothetical protein
MKRTARKAAAPAAIMLPENELAAPVAGVMGEVVG